MTDANRNWAGNIAYSTATVRTPRNLAELQDAVRNAPKARGLGSRHSFNRIADTDAELISLRGLERIMRIDKAARTVTIDGGITYGELCPILDREGFALHNLASLPHISVAGAATTATHGSGSKNKNLATSVAALNVVTASGEIVSLKRGDPDFDGAVVGLGALGIVSELTLDIQPRFEVRQNLFTDLPFAALVENFEAIMGAAYSVSLFTAWHGDTLGHVWLKTLIDAPEPRGISSAPGRRRVPGIRSPSSTPPRAPSRWACPARGICGCRISAWSSSRAPAPSCSRSSLSPAPTRPAALRALKAVEDTIAPQLMIAEIRTIAADTLWLSPCYQTDRVAFHFTFKPDWPAVQKVLPVLEWALRPFNARAHWGKLFTMTPSDVQAGYTMLEDFRALARRYDPKGKFRNPFIDAYVF